MANNRPNIPAEIRRKVLLEAGHRCAIPHCSHTQVDLHHIVAWEKCKEHSPENLIALCPNCHRRADSGEIDRKSLIVYKLRGENILTGNSPKEIVSDNSWTTQTIREQKDDMKYEAELEYPYFDLDQYEWAKEVNVYIQAMVLFHLQDIRNIANEAPWTWSTTKTEESNGISSLGASYEVTFFSQSILSIRFSFFYYGYGAAHPNHWTKSLNIFINPVYNIELHHFFLPEIDYLQELSRVVRNEYFQKLSLESESVDKEWVNKGTEPNIENFSNFNMKKDGLLFSFDEYSIGCYAAGRQEVLVPYSKLEGLVLPQDFQ